MTNINYGPVNGKLYSTGANTVPNYNKLTVSHKGTIHVPAQSPMDPSEIAKNESWYLYDTSGSNCRATVVINSRDMYAAINQNGDMRCDVVIGHVSVDTPHYQYLWNPERDLLVPIDSMYDVVYLASNPDPVGFSCAVSKAPTYVVGQKDLQGCWYKTWRGYTSGVPGDPDHQIPANARKFKLKDHTPLVVPEFKDGDQVYDWLESQLD